MVELSHEDAATTCCCSTEDNNAIRKPTFSCGPLDIWRDKFKYQMELGLRVYPLENWGSRGGDYGRVVVVQRDVGSYVPNYKALHPRRQYHCSLYRFREYVGNNPLKGGVTRCEPTRVRWHYTLCCNSQSRPSDLMLRAATTQHVVLTSESITAAIATRVL
jgi:hypothetical protein